MVEARARLARAFVSIPVDFLADAPDGVFA
jgi:hypothetical protein